MIIIHASDKRTDISVMAKSKTVDADKTAACINILAAEVILLAYATQRLVFPWITPILRILQLPQ